MCRVARHEGWFAQEQREKLEMELRAMLQREWDSVLRAVETLFESDNELEDSIPSLAR